MAEVLEIVLSILGAGSAVRQVVELGSALNETARSFVDVQQAAGGALGIGAGIGLSAGQAGGLAARLHDAIAAGGFARSAASQLGVGNVLPRGLGGPNDAEIMVRLAEGIRRVTNATDAYNLSLRLQAPELQRLRLLGDQQIKNIRTLGEEIKRTFSPEAQARIARFQSDLEVLQQRAILWVIRLFDELLLTPLYGTNNEIHQSLSKLSGSMDANTAALGANTVAIGQMRQVFGGGGRARGAFPAGLRGELLRKQFESDAIKLGAFAL